MISTNFIADLETELSQKRAEKEMILDQIAILDVQIDRYDAIIENMDRSIIPLIDEINVAISSVKTAYDNRVSAGCKSDLIWVETGRSTYGYGTSETTRITYQAQKNPAVRTDYGKWGAKYYRRPQNQDYGSNIVKEFTGTAGYGATNLSVVSVGGTLSIELGDIITDSIDNPLIYNSANLPNVVGFGVSTILLSEVDFGGSVAFGSTIIAHVGVGSTVGINTGDTITKLGVLSPGTTVVGFGTTSFDIEVWDYASGTFISSSTSAPSLIISSAAVGTATTTFTVGLSSEFPSLLLDQPTNVAATNTFFTVIRTTQAVLDRFDATNNPVDPVTIAILNNNTLGLGHTLVRVNNGSPAGPFQWREVLGEFAPEPACGNGFSRYYPGNNSWPGFTTRQYSSAGVSVASTFYYATEGTIKTVGAGSTLPESVTVGYQGTSSQNPSAGTCSALDTAITNAETSRDAIIARNQPIIDSTAAASNSRRRLRDKLESNAFAMLQGRAYTDSEIVRITNDLSTLRSLDLRQYEPTTYRSANRFSSNRTGIATTS